jgi:hypothetical protein
MNKIVDVDDNDDVPKLPSVREVTLHLNFLKHHYDNLQNLDKYKLYDTLVHNEREYIESLRSRSTTSCNNFCSVVHKLCPAKYVKDVSPIRYETVFPVANCLKCYSCQRKLSSEESYVIHIEHGEVVCHCASKVLITLESLIVQLFILKYNISNQAVLAGFITQSHIQYFPARIEGQHSTWVTLIVWLKLEVLKKHNKPKNMPDLRHQLLSMAAGHDHLSCVSFDLVHGMYRQLDFMNKICCNYDYWNDADIIKQSIARYGKFVMLSQPTISLNKCLVPTMDIDLVWHAHQCDHESYTSYCNHVAGRMLNHDDTIESEDLLKGYARTFIFWGKYLNESYSYHPPELARWHRGHECRSLMIPFYLQCRLDRWMKYSKTSSNYPPTNRPSVETPVMVALVDTTRAFYGVINDALSHIRSRPPTNNRSYISVLPDGTSTVGCGGGCAVGFGCGHGGGHGCGGGLGCGGHGGSGGCGGGGCGGCGG